MSNLSLWKTVFFTCVIYAMQAITSPAQTFTTLLSFNGTDGAEPVAVLVQGTDGNFYGTTAAGGTNSNANFCNNPGFLCGTVFKITPTGTMTTLYNFCAQTGCTDGADPGAGLVQATDGNFYGTTPEGGANGPCNGYGCGTIFKITAGGALTTLHSFDGTDGSYPNGLVLATNGDFYGTTNQGGANNAGTIFKMTADGTLTTLYNFCSQTNCTDGSTSFAALIQATDRNLYGTTWAGGASGLGTVFKITPSGTLTTLHSFDGSDGSYPYAGLVQATDGNFYGTTARGGTVFKMTPGGTLTTLATVGALLYAGLVQASDGNLYGTNYLGGANGAGFVFKITLKGVVTTLYNFCSQTGCTDGADPLAGLMQATNGNFYGTTVYGGDGSLTCAQGIPGCGAAFNLSVGLGPFVETRPTSGKVGAAVIILGNNLKGSTSVTFNGTPATFKVVSSTEIKTTVPSGATTGRVNVVTPSRTLTSNVNFRVTPATSSSSPRTGPAAQSR